jgi:hypothetical protein
MVSTRKRADDGRIRDHPIKRLKGKDVDDLVGDPNDFAYDIEKLLMCIEEYIKDNSTVGMSRSRTKASTADHAVLNLKDFSEDVIHLFGRSNSAGSAVVSKRTELGNEMNGNISLLNLRRLVKFVRSVET